MILYSHVHAKTPQDWNGEQCSFCSPLIDRHQELGVLVRKYRSDFELCCEHCQCYIGMEIEILETNSMNRVYLFRSPFAVKTFKIHSFREIENVASILSLHFLEHVFLIRVWR